MSDLIRTLNHIKTRRSHTWLTPSQREALIGLRRALQVPGPVNLFGAIGVGKTFLAWTLADELGFSYLPHTAQLKQVEALSTTGVILDNCHSDRRSHRDILKTLQFLNTSHAVLVTRQMIDDYTHYVELKLTSTDQAKVRDTLEALGLYHEVDQVPHLWHLVNPHLQEEAC